MIGFTTAECSLIDQATKDLKPADGNQRELRTVRDCIKEVVKGGEVLLHFTGEQLQTLIRALERKEMIEDERDLSQYLYDLLRIELGRLQEAAA